MGDDAHILLTKTARRPMPKCIVLRRVVPNWVGATIALIHTIRTAREHFIATGAEEILVCKALLDRVTDRAHIIETGTESYRFRRTVEGREKKKVT